MNGFEIGRRLYPRHVAEGDVQPGERLGTWQRPQVVDRLRYLFLGCLGAIAISGSVGRAQMWTQLHPSTAPPARAGSSAVYVPSTNTMIVFGGALSTCGTVLNEVWALSNANGLGGTPQWTEISPSGSTPNPRRGATAVYNPTDDRLVVFGGDLGSCSTNKANDTWVLINASGKNGSPAWQKLSPSGGPPGIRSDHVAVYDVTNNIMTIFGGTNGVSGQTYSDTWVLSDADGTNGGSQWTQLSPSGGPPPGTELGTAVYDSASDRMTVYGGLISCCNPPSSNQTWTLTNANGVGGTPQWVLLSTNGAATPTWGFSPLSAFNASANEMFLFGGAIDDGTVYNGTWVLSCATGLGCTPSWSSLKTGTPVPTPRGGSVNAPALAYDQVTNQMIVFGGGTLGSYLNDTWLLSLNPVALSPTSLNFGNVPVLTTSQSQTITITNSGGGNLVFSGFTAGSSTAFKVVSTLGNACQSLANLTLGPGASCSVQVTFSPTVAGPLNGTLSISDNSGNSPQGVLLTGTATAPAATLSVTNLSFSSQALGTPSAAQSITLTNGGNAPLSISGVAVSGDFAQTNTCGSSVNAATSCTTSVTFNPSTPGARTGTLTITDNASTSPQVVTLTGTGTGPVVNLSATSISFTTNNAVPLTVQNTGNAPLAVSAVSISQGFSETNTCVGASIPTNGPGCTVTVSYIPSASGAQSGTLTILDNAIQKQQVVTLSVASSDVEFGPAPSTPTSQPVQQGGTANFPLVLVPTPTFNGTVTLTCTVQPVGPTCSVRPTVATVSAATGPANVFVTLTTVGSSMVAPRYRLHLGPPTGLQMALLGCVVLLLLLTAVLSETSRRVRSWLPLSTAVLLVALMTGCGLSGGGPPGVQLQLPPPTPLQTYAVAVKATTSTGAVHTLNLSLTVTSGTGGGQ